MLQQNSGIQTLLINGSGQLSQFFLGWVKKTRQFFSDVVSVMLCSLSQFGLRSFVRIWNHKLNWGLSGSIISEYLWFDYILDVNHSCPFSFIIYQSQEHIEQARGQSKALQGGST